MAKVSVIVPVYGVEKYIERCARSLFEQTLDDIEYIFVDDCTPDRSIEILKTVLDEYPQRIPQTRILRMEKNSGQGAVRKCGMMAATGDYMIHCDSDDWVELDMYEKLYAKAISSQADITVCNFWEDRPNGSTIRDNFIMESPIEVIRGIEHKTVHFSLWVRLMKAGIISENNIYPEPGINYWEDKYTAIRAYYYANKVAYIQEPLYHYNLGNPTAISRGKEERILQDEIRHVQLLDDFFRSKEYSKYKPFLTKEKAMLKISYIFDLEKFCETFPEERFSFLKIKSLSIPFRIICVLLSFKISFPYKLYLWLNQRFCKA